MCFGKNVTVANVDTPRVVTFPISYTKLPSVVTTNSKHSKSAAPVNVSGISITIFKAHSQTCHNNTFYAENFCWISMGY